MKLFRALALTLLVSSWALAQNAALMPIPKQQFFTKQGKPLAGGLIYTYAAGTSTPLATYTDSTGTVQNTNPVVLDSGGFGNIWLGISTYKIVAQNYAGAPEWTVDGVQNNGFGIVGSKCLPNGLACLDASGFVPQAELNYTQAGSGSVNRSVQNKLQESVTFLDFGAAGDGTTLDTTAVQNTLNSGAPVVDGGGKTYLVSNIIVPSNITLQNFSIKVAGGSAVPTSGLTIDGLTVPKTNIILRNISIDGNRKNMSNFGVVSDGDKSCFRFVGNVSNVLLDHVTGNFCGTDGLQLFSYTRPATDNDSDLRFHNIVVRNSTFKYNRRMGVSLDSAVGVTFANITGEYNGLDEDEIQTLYAAAPNMTDLVDWQSGSYTAHATCLVNNSPGDCAAKTVSGNYYQNGIDIEGYGVGSGLHGVSVLNSRLLHNANGGLNILDSTAVASTGWKVRQGITVVGNQIDQGIYTNTNIPWPYALNIDGPLGEYTDVTFASNVVSGVVSVFGTNAAAVTGNRISTGVSYALFTGGSTNLEFLGNETDGKGINFFDSLGTVNAESFNRTAATTNPLTASNYAAVFGSTNTPLAIGGFTGFDAIQTFGVPLALQPGANHVLIGTTTDWSGLLQVGGAIVTLQDTSSTITMGRFSAGNPFALFNAQDSDGTSTPSGFAFAFNGAASVFQVLPATIKHTGLKSTTGTRYVCVDTSGNFVSSASACSGT